MTPNLDDKREPGHASESTRLSPTAPSQMSNRTKIAIAAAGALVLVAGGVLIGGRLGGEGDPAAQAAPTAPVDIRASPEASSTIPEELSAESLSALSPEEITSRFTITANEASTPEQYVEAFLERQNALHNVGSAADFEENGIEVDATGQTYSLALNKKYILPALTGLYGVENDPDFVDQNFLWQTFRKFSALNVGIPEYEAAITLSEGSLSITQTADGFYDITFRVIHTDNLDATAFMGDEERWKPYEATYNLAFTGMHVNDQGVWVAESWAQ